MNLGVNTSMHSGMTPIIVPVFEEKEPMKTCDNCKRFVDSLRTSGKFKGEFGEVYQLSRDTEEGIKDIILLGLGKEEEINIEKIRIATAKAFRKAKELKIKKLNMKSIESEKLCASAAFKAIFEGAALANYDFNKYKSKKNEDGIEEFNIISISENKIDLAQKALEEAKNLIEAVILSRDMVNEPANVIYPETLAEKALEIGKQSGFEVQILNKNEIEELGMEAFLAVARGSVNEPKLIIMRYFGDNENKNEILGFVGKGLTYDSGGYSLKPTDGMVTMKSDMGGASAVIGAMSAIAKTHLKVNVVGVVAACENMISGGAYKPGDIIGSMAGKTIEILNADAEGRLTLADAVYYAVSKEKATKVVDVATLTGAALVALGKTTTAVISNNDKFYEKLQKASEVSGEKIWQLPAFDEYKELIKSDIADLKNTGGRLGGTITAGLFIGEFVQDKPWLHLDIAGTSWADSNKNYLSKGGTGVGVRTLYYLAKKIYE